MWTIPFWCLISLSVISGNNASAKQITFTAGESSFSRDFFENFTYSVANNKVNLDMFLKKPLVKGWLARLNLKRRMPNSKSYQSIFTTTIDVCNTVNRRNMNLMQKWFKNSLKYGNFPNCCPTPPGHHYLHGWQFGKELLPPFVTAGSYRLETYNFYGNYQGTDEIFVMCCAALATVTP